MMSQYNSAFQPNNNGAGFLSLLPNLPPFIQIIEGRRGVVGVKGNKCDLMAFLLQLLVYFVIKQACYPGYPARKFSRCNPTKRYIHLFSKNTLTFEPIMQFDVLLDLECPKPVQVSLFSENILGLLVLKNYFLRLNFKLSFPASAPLHFILHIEHCTVHCMPYIYSKCCTFINHTNNNQNLPEWHSQFTWQNEP